MLLNMVANETSAASHPPRLWGEDVPASTQQDFNVGEKVGRSQHRGGAKIDAGTEPRRDVECAA